ncbi:MAG: hypothetical protein EU532_07615 [Promethearchaeota archaeon]|nr:MAG: hypothetical protein EU532_07615 [Candidatus Lokiarchaeota archaeon]
MSAIDKLIKAKNLFERLIDDLIVSLSINIDFKRLHILLKDGVEIYIVYNNYDEYSYSIIFSKIEFDRCRFDNYDNLWEVSSRPHHLHPRKTKTAISSSMSGDPQSDIPLLCDLLKTGKLN